MKVIVPLLWLILSPLLLLGSDPYPVNKAIDVQHYVFRLQISAAHDTLAATATIDVLLKEAVQAFDLDLQNQSEKGGMAILRLTINGHESEFSHLNNRISITTNGKAGDVLQIEIDYKGVPQDGLVIGPNLFGDKTFFGDNWPDRAHHWLPTVDHPSDKATCEFIVQAPVYYEVVANGSLKEETILTKETKLTHWVESVPIPTKVMVFGAAMFAVDHVGHVGDIPVQSWVYRQNREAGFYDYAPAKEILATLQDVIGPYPFEKLANVQSKTRYGGMENAGNIFYFEKSVTGKRTIEGLIAHEIAHQWFGNSASEKDWHHVWLSEGFATYFTQVYMERTYGTDSLKAGMKKMLPGITEYHDKHPASPIVDTTIVELKKVLSTNTYQKASWVLHMLRRQVGDEAFFEGVSQYYDTYKFSNALTDDFRTVMEEVSGQQLGWFFDQWLRTPLLPTLSVSWSYKKKTGKLAVKVTGKDLNDSVRLPLEIGIRNENGDLAETRQLELKGGGANAEWELPFTPSGLFADPNVWLLANIETKKR